MQNNQMVTLYRNIWQKKQKKNNNNNNNDEIKQEEKGTVKVKMVKKLCA